MTGDFIRDFIMDMFSACDDAKEQAIVAKVVMAATNKLYEKVAAQQEKESVH